jgi:hypothetical protein
MNTKKTAITIVAAMMVVAMITTVAMAAICDEPCGTKVTQCTDGAPTKDAVYALVIPGCTPGVPAMALAYWDADGSGAFEDGECVYIDTDAGPVPPAPAQNFVESGDVRLCGYCGTPANTPVMACDTEVGLVLTYPPQNLVGYVDADLSGYYDITDPLYLDMDLNSQVTPHDIRLTGFMGYAPYSVVAVGDTDNDIGSPIQLDDLVLQGGLPLIVTPINQLLGFVDTSCDNMWDNRTTLLAAGAPVATGEDKLYLQQPVLAGINLAIPNNIGALDPFEDFVTIGDFRLYMPPEEPCWPDCGDKVEQCDPDATYPLLIPDFDVTLAQGLVPGMLLRWVDTNGDTLFDGNVDHVYIDTDGGALPDTVRAGDVRVTEACGCPPNTVVGQCSFCDVGDTYSAAPQNVVGYVDVGVRNGVYDLGDPLYLDISVINGVGANLVSQNDIRLTERTVGGVTYPAWSVVQNGDTDTYINPIALNDPANVPQVPTSSAAATPINDLLGFVDSNCDGLWATDGTDKLYLQQIVFPLVDLDGDLTLDPTVNQFDRFTTIGDFRMYMPEEDCWPDCGVKVVECDIDATGALLRSAHDVAPAPLNGVIPLMSIAVSSSGCVYIDVNGGAGAAEVEVGDVRLTSCCGMDPNTVVDDCDCDWGTPVVWPVAISLLGYVDDLNGNGIYDVNDPLYLDLDQIGFGADGFVSPGDLRLTGRVDLDPSYLPYTLVAVGDLDEDGSAVGNQLFCPKNNIPLTFNALCMDVNYYLGFRDSDCTGLWDDLGGGDELYLQQMVPEPFGVAVQEPQFNMFSTIGDFRIYIPVGPTNPCEIYDADSSGTIELSEVIAAIDDYFDDVIDLGTVIEVIDCYFE